MRRPRGRAGCAVVAALALGALQPAFAEPGAQVQTRCFRFAAQPQRLVQLRLVETDDANEAAFVRYVGSPHWIALALSRSKATPQADSGRSQVDQEWVEIVHDQVGGRYLLSMLGNEVVSFQYVNRATGARTEFRLATLPRGQDACAPG